MPISVVCPQCSAKLNAPESAAGKKVKCPKCSTAIVVPTPLPAEPAESGFEVVDEPQLAKTPAVKAKVKAVVTSDEDKDQKPRKKAAKAEVEEDEKPRKKPAADAEDDEPDEDDRPQKKKKKAAAGNSNMTRNIIGGVVLLVLLGVAGWVFYDKFGKSDDTAGNTNPNPKPPVERPGPGGPNQTGGPVENPKFTKIMGLLVEWDKVVNSSTDALNAISNLETALSAAKQIVENTEKIRKLTQDMRGMEKLTDEETRMPSAPRRGGSGTWAYVTAEKRISGLLASEGMPTEAKDALRPALTNWARANLELDDALAALTAHTFTSPAGFKITFPGPYRKDEAESKRRTEQTGMPITVHDWADEVMREHFSVSAMDVPRTLSQQQKANLSENFIAGFTKKESKMQLLSRQLVTVAGREWIELDLKERAAPGALTARRLLTTDDHFFVLSVTKQGNILPATLKRFFDSFELTKPSPAGNPAQPPKGDARTLAVPGRFEVTFPNRYGTEDTLNKELTKQLAMEAKMYIAGTLADGKAYTAWACTFPAGASADEKQKRSQSLRDYLTRGELGTRNMVTVKGRQWEEITLKDRGSSETPVMRILQTDKSIYALMGQKEAGDALTQFMDSFVLLE